jgi:hypothetical protein
MMKTDNIHWAAPLSEVQAGDIPDCYMDDRELEVHLPVGPVWQFTPVVHSEDPLDDELEALRGCVGCP